MFGIMLCIACYMFHSPIPVRAADSYFFTCLNPKISFKRKFTRKGKMWLKKQENCLTDQDLCSQLSCYQETGEMWTLLSLSLWFSAHIWTLSHCLNEQGIIYITWGHSRAGSWWSWGTVFLTISFVLGQVLAFKELARWIISFTNSTSIQHSFGTKSMVTPYLLQPKGTSEGLRQKGIWRNSCIFPKGVNCPLIKKKDRH